MAKPELSLIEERDETQRALGCVGLSAFAHLGLLIFVLIAPSLRDSAGIVTGTKAGLELPGETIANAAPAGAAQAADTSGPVEVMLADANDPNAVALPNTPPPPTETQAAEVKPVETAVVVKQDVAKPTKSKAAKPTVESTDISSALSHARTEAAKAPAKPAKFAAPPAAAAIETADESDVATPVTQANEQEQSPTEQPAVTTADEDDNEEAVPLQVALPEEESLTQAQANTLQAPNAKVDEIPADAKPIEQVQRTTGAVITRPVNSAPRVATNTAQSSQAAQPAIITRGLPASSGATGTTAGTASGATQSRGGTQGVGIPYGAQVRDARTLQAMPGNPLATYPLPDRIANREGTTVLLGHVRNDGKVENVSLERSSGSRMMDESAAKAFSQWKYRPGQEGYVRLPMQFKLVGDAHVIPAELKRQ